MKTTLSLLICLIATACSAASPTPPPAASPKPLHNQIRIVFEDNEVPQFIVIENKGKKRIVIDRHGQTLSDDKALSF